MWKLASLSLTEISQLEAKIEDYKDGVMPTIPYVEKRTLLNFEPSKLHLG
jgi:hypothetical protein